MKRIVDSKTMAGIDAAAHGDYGFPEAVLMENAGIRGYEKALSLSDNPRKMTFVCGTGNNGGDALVMARQCLVDGREPSVVMLSDDPGGLCGKHLRVCRSMGIPVHIWPERRGAAREAVRNADAVFDGITGTGLRGKLRPAAEDAAGEISGAHGVKFAIDAPSGVGDAFRAGFPAVRADYTLTFELPKRALYLPYTRPFCGRIVVLPIGFPAALTFDPDGSTVLLEDPDLERLLPHVAPQAYKNSRGWVAVFAGSPGTTGAALLAAEAAARSRAGLVSLFAEPAIFPTVAGRLRSIMPKPWDPAAGADGFDLSPFSALVVGPGWGFQGRKPWLARLLSGGIPGVLDADGISLLGDFDPLPDLGGRWILTPHPGEFARLSGIGKDEILSDPAAIGCEWAQKLRCILVLKGHVTYICSPDGRYAVVDGMNPALGTAGSGDVLAGIIGGLLAAGAQPEQAARGGVLLHARSGQKAYAAGGWFLSEDLLPFISKAAV